ncbi:hypothetical protein FB45DRAFT_882848 [Roridomyces roridus]|uniref:Uncharacterized protein n=1 Tax=Roridomyces roridus TaxID=1738132 RepID=A0AAD7AX64_9AGAR|nr:hypothetical protein FB45DRAFT_882848 [Roridomyces roridus]
MHRMTGTLRLVTDDVGNKAMSSRLPPLAGDPRAEVQSLQSVPCSQAEVLALPSKPTRLLAYPSPHHTNTTPDSLLARQVCSTCIGPLGAAVNNAPARGTGGGPGLTGGGGGYTQNSYVRHHCHYIPPPGTSKAPSNQHLMGPSRSISQHSTKPEQAKSTYTKPDKPRPNLVEPRFPLA